MYRTVLILFFLVLSPVSAFSSDTAESVNSYVLPELTTQTQMSSSDINRIVCQADIKDVIFSKEKGVSVKISGRDAFVKFLITKKEDKEIYSSTPSELFVICGNDVYSLITVPKRIPSQTVRLSSGRSEKIKKNISLMEGLPFEKKITGLIKTVYKEDIPDSFSISYSNRKIEIFKDIRLTLRRTVAIEGEGLQIKEYSVEMKMDSPRASVQILEKDFLRTEITERPVAISIDRLNLKKGDSARLFIVEQTGGVQ
jgi:conjugal transfer pilus assembly protein TraK